MDFVSNPALPTVKPSWPGNPREGGRFRAYAEPIDPSFGKLARYLATRNPQAAEKRRDDYRPPTIRGDVHADGDWVCWLGHASFLIQLDGVRLLTDPVFGNLGLLRRRVAQPFDLEGLGPIDYVLLSHDHRDHCDEATLRRLARVHDFRVLTTLGMGDLLGPWLARDQGMTEAGWYQRYDVDDLEITLMPTQHWCRRYLTDTNRRLWGSFVLRGGGKTLWFGGDSAYAPHFAEVNGLFPGIDLAMIGIGAYKPAWFMQAAHTSPAQAWRGFEDCGARRLVPMHYGTYDLSREPPGEPRRLIRALAEKAGRSGDLTLPAVGQVVRV